MLKSLACSLLFASLACAQGGPASHIIAGPNLPTKCSFKNGDVFVKYTSSASVMYWCDSTNHFSSLSGGGGGGVTPTGSPATGQIAVWSGSTSITGDTNATLASGKLTLTGGLQTGTGSGLAGALPMGSGTLPTFGAGANQIPTTGFTGWAGALSGVAASYMNQIPVVIPTANQVMVFPAPTSGLTQGTWSNVARMVASGTSALGTSLITSGACATVVTTSATGTLTTDVISWTPNGSIKAVTGYAPSTSGGLSIAGYPSADNVNWDVCNWTSSSITPSAVTLNWQVTRQ